MYEKFKVIVVGDPFVSDDHIIFEGESTYEEDRIIWLYDVSEDQIYLVGEGYNPKIIKE